MAKRSKPIEIVETDRLEGFAHPRTTHRLIGQDEALVSAARAIRGGRPPQAWLITGPPGIGKATFAYRVARYLLAFGATADGPADLSVPENDTASIQVASASHPGMLVLKRGYNDQGKLMTVLSVEEIRRLGGFFGMTSGAGGWRVAIVDTADDMNDAAANALLKLLEEPPSRAMLLLIANVPGRLLPTIRSRCQRLNLRPLKSSAVEAELKTLVPELDAKERASIARLSGGSIGLALQLASGEGVSLAGEADQLIEHAAVPDFAALMTFADKLNRMTDGLDNFGAFLSQALMDRIRARATKNPARLDRWIEAWEKLERNFARTSGLHLDPRQTLLSSARTLGDAAQRAGTL